MPTRHPTIADTTLELIRARGPLTLDALAPLVVDAGRTRAKDPRRAVESAITHKVAFLEGSDGRWHSAVDQLEGAIFTVRPTDLERREEIVLVRDDLALVARLLRRDPWEHPDQVHLDEFDAYFGLPYWDFDLFDIDDPGEPFRDGSRTIRTMIGDARSEDLLAFLEDIGVPRGPDDEAGLRLLIRRVSGLTVMHGPPGWMPDLEPRELLGLRIRAGVVHAVAINPRETNGPHVVASAQRIAGVAARGIGPDATWFRPGLSIETLLGWVATDAPELLRRPVPPIGDLICRSGLVLDDGFVRHPAPRRAA